VTETDTMWHEEGSASCSKYFPHRHEMGGVTWIAPEIELPEYPDGVSSVSLVAWHDRGDRCASFIPHRHEEGYIRWARWEGRTRTSSGGAKDNVGKPRVDLLPMKALEQMAAVLGYGADKYRPHNWRLGLLWSETLGSAMRHLMRFQDGEDLDPETGMPHLAHAMCQVGFLLEYSITSTGTDDRFASTSREEARA
jgi:hypothetical protein